MGRSRRPTQQQVLEASQEDLHPREEAAGERRLHIHRHGHVKEGKAASELNYLYHHHHHHHHHHHYHHCQPAPQISRWLESINVFINVSGYCINLYVFPGQITFETNHLARK